MTLQFPCVKSISALLHSYTVLCFRPPTILLFFSESSLLSISPGTQFLLEGKRSRGRDKKEKKFRKAVSVEVSQIELVVTMEMVLIGYRACAEWSKPISQGNRCWKFQKRPLPWVGLVVEKLCSLNSNCFVSLLIVVKLWENWVSTEYFRLFICQLG